MKKMNKLYMGTNTKMYKTIADTVDYLNELSTLTEDLDRKHLELFVIPSFTALESASKTVSPESIKIGAQNMCWEEQGQFTGEISPLMIKEIGVSIIEIGHSERRHVFGETDTEENKKVLAALKHEFTPLLCVGETLEQRQLNVSDEYLRIQLKVGLDGVTREDAHKLWIAYEPVWAIGVNGIPATAEYADNKQKVIKNTLIELFGDAGLDIPVLYGGSVNPDNVEGLIQMPNIDGLFIGRSAWDAKGFNKLIRQAMPLFMGK
ncbi:MAG: triose-phosphate isomerase [Clostridia bacterium BRH_c25]|nr:MAG: triose-phosphate isomerase [Clostridia bacterium BRH_c25]